jgi:hypothetical protein
MLAGSPHSRRNGRQGFLATARCDDRKELARRSVGRKAAREIAFGPLKITLLITRKSTAAEKSFGEVGHGSTQGKCEKPRGRAPRPPNLRLSFLKRGQGLSIN